jgi:hypothetical protein
VAVDIETLNRLLQEHEAIRAQLQWLEKSIHEMFPQSTDALLSPESLKGIKEKVHILETVLSYLKEAVVNHIAGDIETVKFLVDKTGKDEEEQVHAQIVEELDRALRLTELAGVEKSAGEELQSYIVGINESIRRFHELIVEHTRLEDVILQKALRAQKVS